MINIILLGSTGSIGRQVLNVVDRYPEKFKIVSMTAGSNAVLFTEQINKYKPKIAVLANPEKLYEISEIPKETALYYGEKSLTHAIVEEGDIVVDAIMGFAGLTAVKESIKLKKNIALANKETLVAGGGLIMPLARENGVEIIPVDSEHSAIWQCLSMKKDTEFSKLILTASGGAFRDKSLEELKSVSVKDALNHPNWLMGKKITIDCATMINKGFEVLEAMWLFNCPLEKTEVVIHPQSIVHSMVEFCDGSVLAQMGNPSMELPIQLAFTYPKRLKTNIQPLSFKGRTLEFKEVDYKKYPCFKLCLDVIKMGDNFPCALSGADEEAVNLFLQGKISYLDIFEYIEYAINKTERLNLTFDSLYYTDENSRRLVRELYYKRRNLC